jgi:prolyl-tRNA synthetase
MRAESGPIGGDMSHEFVILADTGESEIAYHRDFLEMSLAERTIDFEADLQPIVDAYVGQYAATDDERDRAKEAELGSDVITGRGIEVGHIFYFGSKYSGPMGARVTGPGGEASDVQMGSYGIGVSRLVGAIIEAFHDDAGILWPESVAPFKAAVINLSANNAACTAASEALYYRLQASGVDVLYDDREERPGVKFADMDLIGLPWQVIAGPKGVQAGVVELKNRATGERRELSAEAAVSFLVS